MRIFKSKKQLTSSPWQTYLNKAYHLQDTQRQAASLERFWNEYQELIASSKKLAAKPLQADTTISPIDLPTIFSNYWDNSKADFTYKELKTVNSYNKLALITTLLVSAMIIFGLIKGRQFISLEGFASIYFYALIWVLGLAVFVILIRQVFLKSETRTIKIVYLIKFHPEFLSYTKVDRYQRKYSFEISYNQIRKIKTNGSTLKIKTLSVSDKITNQEIIREFSIPEDVSEYSKIEGFLQAVASHNQAVENLSSTT